MKDVRVIPGCGKIKFANYWRSGVGRREEEPCEAWDGYG
jgi:hypothetical protein